MKNAMGSATIKQSFAAVQLFGELCQDLPKVSPWLLRGLQRTRRQIVLLPFQVERAHLKNVVQCMQLMDILGLFVHGEHTKAVVKHVSTLDHSSQRTRRVDVIVKESFTFKGYDALALASLEWLKALQRPCGVQAAFIGRSDLFPSIRWSIAASKIPVRHAAARSAGPTLLILGDLIPEGSKELISKMFHAGRVQALIDLRTHRHAFSPSARNLPLLDRKTLLLHLQLTTVRLLTPHK